MMQADRAELQRPSGESQISNDGRRQFMAGNAGVRVPYTLLSARSWSSQQPPHPPVEPMFPEWLCGSG